MARKDWKYEDSRYSLHGTMRCNSCGKAIEGEYRVRNGRNGFVVIHRACSLDDANWAKLDQQKAERAAEYAKPSNVFADLLDAYEGVFGNPYCQLDVDEEMVARARAALAKICAPRQQDKRGAGGTPDAYPVRLLNESDASLAERVDSWHVRNDRVAPQQAGDGLTDDALIDAAEARAALYDDDPRQDIKTDVMNAFYAGAAFAAPRQPGETVAGVQGRMSNEMRSYIEGMSVSVDVSTGEHDAGNRYYGFVSEVMDDPDDKHGVTLLVQDDVRANFKLATTPAHQEEICDCECPEPDSGVALVSNECPIHNLKPQAASAQQDEREAVGDNAVDNAIEMVEGALELCEGEDAGAFQIVKRALLAATAKAAAFESQARAAQVQATAGAVAWMLLATTGKCWEVTTDRVDMEEYNPELVVPLYRHPSPAVESDVEMLRAVAKEYDECIRHMDAGGDFFEFQARFSAMSREQSGGKSK